MAAVAPTPNPHPIKVYCPVHKLGFSVTAAPVIQCANQNHTMATDFPREGLWHYCCDCQHYFPGQFETVTDCQACDRQIAKRFLCGACQLISVESDNAGRRKMFSISSHGAPQPSCPGCFNTIAAPVRIHECRDYPHPFSTTRSICPFCEASLVPAEIKAAPPVPVVTPLVPEDPNACRNCGTPSTPDQSFCKRCASPLPRTNTVVNVTKLAPPKVSVKERAEPVVEEISTLLPPTPAVTGPSSQVKTAVGVIIALASVGIVISFIVAISASGNSIEKKLDRAIAEGRLFTPATDNAHTLYLQLKNSGASEEKLKLYRERILPALTNQPLKMIDDFMVAGSDDPPIVDWQAAAQSLAWAAELQSNDKKLLSRSLYAQGRVAYLSKDEELALSLWSRASDAEKSWPLPENGIGLIYFGRKIYATARTHYQVAAGRDPNWPYPYNNMGTSYYMQKNYSEAKQFYQKAAELAPRWARPHSWLGDIAMKEHDYTTAIAEFSLALDANATGTKNMDLDKIRRQLELAQQRSVQF